MFEKNTKIVAVAGKFDLNVLIRVEELTLRNSDTEQYYIALQRIELIPLYRLIPPHHCSWSLPPRCNQLYTLLQLAFAANLATLVTIFNSLLFLSLTNIFVW